MQHLHIDYKLYNAEVFFDMINGIRNTPMVMIMEKEHSESKILLANLFRKIIKSSIFISLIGIACTVVLKEWIIGSVHVIFTIGSTFFICRYLMKNIDLTRVGIIEFKSLNTGININEEDVYNTTRSICEIKGMLNSISKSIDFFIIYSSILLMGLTINYIFNLIFG